MHAARGRGEGARAVEASGETARKAVAAVIRSGEPLDANAPEFGGRGTAQSKDKDRSR